MNDPLDALHHPAEPVNPDPAFAARLRARLERALLEPTGAAMTSATSSPDTPTDPAQLPWPPALTPYIGVADARRALEWYVEVFGAERRGEPYVMPDGSIGHAELGIGDAVLMLAEGYPEEGASVPSPGEGTSVSLNVQVPDADATVQRAVERDAELVRPVSDNPYGRMGIIRDPFGHRWMVMTPPPRATRTRHGDVGYITVTVPDDEPAKEFYGAVLGWGFAPGGGARAWHIDGISPMGGLAGTGQPPEVQLCFRVADIASAVQRVREYGGTAGEPDERPYGLLSECVDNQGMRFQLWQPPRG